MRSHADVYTICRMQAAESPSKRGLCEIRALRCEFHLCVRRGLSSEPLGCLDDLRERSTEILTFRR